MSGQNGHGADTVYAQFMGLRDRQREELKAAPLVIDGDALPWELNPQGKTRWYAHPFAPNAIRNLVLSVDEIPPGSRTGKQRVPGGDVLYVWEGRGYTELNGIRHDWEVGDVINLPLVTEGVEVQHFNVDPDAAVKLVHVNADYSHMIGVDMGSGFEQLEPAPDPP